MQDVKKLLCALDLSTHSLVVAEYASTFVAAFNAELLVVHVTPALNQYMNLTASLEPAAAISREIEAGSRKELQAFIENNFAEIPVKTKIVSGEPAEEILTAAVEFGAELIIMGTHGYSGVERLIFGSVAEKVVKGASMPVITIRPEEQDKKSEE